MFWGLAAFCAGAVLWLFWPLELVPPVLRTEASVTSLVGVLWEVEATALALSAAIVTFSFATYSSSRIAQMGGSLPQFARSSGLLAGISVGVVAIAACGGCLSAMPAVPLHSQLSRLHAASAMTALVLGASAVLLIPFMLWRALQAGNRVWLQRELGRRIERTLDDAIARFDEHAYARLILSEVMNEHQIGTASASNGASYKPQQAGLSGVLVDVKLKRLVKLHAKTRTSCSPLLVDRLVAATALDCAIGPTTPLLWSAAEISQEQLRSIFRLDKSDSRLATADDLERLHAQARAAIREDDRVWYREITVIYDDVLKHLIEAWPQGEVAGNSLMVGDEVGLRRLTEDLEAQLREITKLDRQEMIAVATQVPYAAGLRALEQSGGSGLVSRMLWSLAHIAVEASTSSPPQSAARVRSSAADQLFSLLHAAGELL